MKKEWVITGTNIGTKGNMYLWGKKMKKRNDKKLQVLGKTNQTSQNPEK